MCRPDGTTGTRSSAPKTRRPPPSPTASTWSSAPRTRRRWSESSASTSSRTTPGRSRCSWFWRRSRRTRGTPAMTPESIPCRCRWRRTSTRSPARSRPGRRRAPRTWATRRHFLRRFPTFEHERADLYWQRTLEAIQGVDRMVGAVRAELEDQGEWDETILIFTSDNGFMLGEHRLWAKDVPYEESARVPLVVSGPGFKDATASRLVGNVDLPRTIAQLAEVKPAPPAERPGAHGEAAQEAASRGRRQDREPAGAPRLARARHRAAGRISTGVATAAVSCMTCATIPPSSRRSRASPDLKREFQRWIRQLATG